MTCWLGRDLEERARGARARWLQCTYRRVFRWRRRASAETKLLIREANHQVNKSQAELNKHRALCQERLGQSS